jgi:pimeloyl-ACP methyl ester carboxylesterase
LERLLDVRAPNWPSDKGLHLPTPLRPDQPAVLLIHGINATAGGLEKLRRAFEVWGVQVLAFDYPDDGQLAASGERLRTELARLSTDHPTLKLVIVGHSMGGLVARYALEVSSPPPPCVTDLFMLGTPNQGSQLAVGQPWMDLLEGGKSLFAMRLQKVDGGRLLFGINDAAEDLVPGSPFLTRLDRFSRPKGVRYHVAVGRKGFLTAQQQREAVDDLDRILRDRGVSPFLRPAILRFAGAPELQTGRGDGVVTLESALLPGSETSHTFDLDHSELINPRVEPLENGEVFRWIVDTLKWRQHDGK